jgi:hypothetical protein
VCAAQDARKQIPHSPPLVRPKVLLLLNATRPRLVVQANTIKKREWLASPQLTELTLDRANQFYTAAQRILLIEDAARNAPVPIDGSEGALVLAGDAEGVNGVPFANALLTHPDVEIIFPLHDNAAADRILRTIAGGDVKAKGLAALKRHRDSISCAVLESKGKDKKAQASAAASLVKHLCGEGAEAFLATLFLSDDSITEIRNLYGDEVRKPSGKNKSSHKINQESSGSTCAICSCLFLPVLPRSNHLFSPAPTPQHPLPRLLQVGFYFAFITHYLFCLFCLAPVGILMVIIKAQADDDVYRQAQVRAKQDQQEVRAKRLAKR